MNLLKAIGVFMLLLVVQSFGYHSEEAKIAIAAVVAIVAYIYFRGGAVKTVAEVAANTMNTKDKITEKYRELRQDKNE